jgi:hypothetical protein
MVTSRKTGTNIVDATYNSGGGADYGSLAVYESTVDIDTTASGDSTTYRLLIESGIHDDTITINGGLHDETYPLIFQAESGAEVRSSRTSGAIFSTTSATVRPFYIIDPFVYLYDLGFSAAFNTTSNREAVYINSNDPRIVGCHIFDVTNSDTGLAVGIRLAATADRFRLINSIVVDNEDDGIIMVSGCTDGVAYNNTLADNGGIGFSATNTVLAKNIISTGNTGDDFSGSFNASCSNNLSSDTTAPGSSSILSTPLTYASSTDFHLVPADIVCRAAAVNLDGDGDFDFNDALDGDTRAPGWAIGADKGDFGPYVSASLGPISRSSATSLDIASDASVNLGAISRSSAAQLLISGNTDSNLAAISRNSQSALDISASSANNLSGVSRSSQASLLLSGITTSVLGAISPDSNGSLSLTAEASQVLGAGIGASLSALDLSASGSSNLGALSGSSLTNLLLQANSSTTLGNIASVASAERILIATLIATLDQVGRSASASLAISMDVTENLSPIIPVSATALSIIGNSSQTLDSVQDSSFLFMPVLAQSSQLLDMVAASSESANRVTAEANPILADILRSSNGSLSLVADANASLANITPYAVARLVLFSWASRLEIAFSRGFCTGISQLLTVQKRLSVNSYGEPVYGIKTPVDGLLMEISEDITDDRGRLVHSAGHFLMMNKVEVSVTDRLTKQSGERLIPIKIDIMSNPRNDIVIQKVYF